MNTSISVKDLTKTYKLNHQVDQVGGYVSIRDVIVNRFRRLLKTNKKNEKLALNTTEIFHALDGVSFNIMQGERVGIIGRNGAGKSTLLKVISRITAPSQGQLAITGRVASLLEVGTGFHPELTGRENIYLNGAVLGMSRNDIKNKFDEIVAFAEVEKFLDTPVKRYSSGMYMRLAFAVAAHLEPDILVVDEVLAVGDAEFQRKCLGKMRDVGKEGRTVLFVSHNMGAITEFCDRVILLKQGKILADGTPPEMIALYSGKEFNSGGGLLEFPINSTSECSITRVELIGENDNRKNHFDFLETIKIEISYTVKERLSELQLVLILSRDGIDIFNAFDSDDLSEIEPTDAGSHKLRYTIKARSLKEGIYSAKVMAGTGDKLMSETNDSLHFEVVSNRINMLKKSYRIDRTGIIVSPGYWQKL